MNAIIMVLTPKECNLLFNGSMSMLVRKSIPKKLTPPFKVYAYQKKHKGGKAIINEVLNNVYGGGKVVGEFVCDKVEKYNSSWLDGEDKLKKTTCFDDGEIMDYIEYTGKKFFLLHIAAPKRYDIPKELHEFRAVCKKGKTKSNKDCKGCTYAFKGVANKEIICDRAIMRAPRTWVYVEEIEE